MRRILRGLGWGAVAILAIAALLYATRTNPAGPVAGRALSGELVTTPVTDWSFTDEHSLIAVETRPAAPHSVTTLCFTVDGRLYVPARAGSTESWTHYAISDPTARVLVGGRVYPVRATRITDEALVPALRSAAAAKYEAFFDADGEIPEDVWLFRMDSAVDVAAR